MNTGATGSSGASGASGPSGVAEATGQKTAQIVSTLENKKDGIPVWVWVVIAIVVLILIIMALHRSNQAVVM